MTNRAFIAATLFAAAVALPACSPTIRKPRLVSPGNAPTQRSIATQFDPYPPPDLGPEIVGGRPPDYAIPVPEVTRARQYADSLRTNPAAIPLAPSLAPSAPSVYVPTLPPVAAPAPPPIEYRY
jgi:hypothetical protein